MINVNENCDNKNCVGGVITTDGQSGKLCKKCNPGKPKRAPEQILWKGRSFKDSLDYHWLEDGYVDGELRFSMFCEKADWKKVKFHDVRSGETTILAMGTKVEGYKRALFLLSKDGDENEK